MNVGEHVHFQVLVHAPGPRRYMVGSGVIEKIADEVPVLTPTGRPAKRQPERSITVRAGADYWVPGVLVDVSPAMGDTYRRLPT